MEGYLRLGLLMTAGIIVFLILFDGWYRKRQLKRSIRTSHDATITLDPDVVLGLDLEKPISPNNPVFSAITKLEESPLYIEDKIKETENEEELVEEEEDIIPTALPLVQSSAAPIKKINLEDDLMVINVLAKRGQVFASYNLLQTLLACGLQFGDMNIFHYYSPAALGREKLFSLASVTEPGEFDLDKIGEFSCRGLSLFTRLSVVSDPLMAYDLMVKTATQLADELDGALYTATHVPLSHDLIQKFRLSVSQNQVKTQA
ncbi:MAG: cell division protein ZipA C-terminal FtsZ-binding domain-containing protein [Gammaproteobacteria bacterium]|nr:cell division protein ZipA C-terminal FtsZ-binding domain-containing protein [Gammaproteobacteria bacterium]